MSTPSKLTLLAESPEASDWISLGRSTKLGDRDGNTLTLIELSARGIEDALYNEFAGRVATTSQVILRVGELIRSLGRTPPPVKRMPPPDYGVPEVKDSQSEDVSA